MQLCREAYTAWSDGSVAALSPIDIPINGNRLRVAGGTSLDGQLAGVRSVFHGTDLGVVVILDSTSGETLCLTDYPFAKLRSSATAALATQQLSRLDAKLVGLLGSGRNAPGYLRGICAVRKIEQIKVYSLDGHHLKSFARAIEDELGVNVTVGSSAQDVVADAEIICVSTNSKVPVLYDQWTSPGSFTISMGRPCELDSSIYREADQIVVSYKSETEQTHIEANSETLAGCQLLDLCNDGTLDWLAVHQIGEIFSGRVSLKIPPNAKTIFKDFQGGFPDAILSIEAFRRSAKSGLGVSVDLS